MQFEIQIIRDRSKISKLPKIPNSTISHCTLNYTHVGILYGLYRSVIFVIGAFDNTVLVYVFALFVLNFTVPCTSLDSSDKTDKTLNKNM
jgi:hypothetical protein